MQRYSKTYVIARYDTVLLSCATNLHLSHRMPVEGNIARIDCVLFNFHVPLDCIEAAICREVDLFQQSPRIDEGHREAMIEVDAAIGFCLHLIAAVHTHRACTSA